MKTKEPPVFTVEFINDSLRAGDVCLYQRLVNGVEGSAPLVWLTKAAAPTTRVVFQWTEDFAFYWQDWERDPAGRVVASQLWPADLVEGNQVTLGRGRRGIYTFRDVEEGPHEGRLYVVQDRTVLHDTAQVGFAVAGFPAHVVKAQPNLTTIFRPEVTYWIAFGQFDEREEIDLSLMTNAVELPFRNGVRSVTARLRRENNWTVKAAPRRARKRALTRRTTVRGTVREPAR